MKLVQLIDYLLNPNTLNKLFSSENINAESEVILIYMKESISLDSEIKLFEIEKTEDDLLFKDNGISYIQLFPIDHVLDLIESDLNLKGKGYSNVEIANRLLDYRIKDA